MVAPAGPERKPPARRKPGSGAETTPGKTTILFHSAVLYRVTYQILGLFFPLTQNLLPGRFSRE